MYKNFFYSLIFLRSKDYKAKEVIFIRDAFIETQRTEFKKVFKYSPSVIYLSTDLFR